ncbi:Uncharacterized protein APZ42_029268 [Daphnia magna]|uniref:Uncharacterized protein n=1 Tax=Daphnia magna TaxID=35525 RepID=A0A164PSD3_9CRUS|nr:Uncharacterized protein APZ42_029268 [Daphnia magna]
MRSPAFGKGRSCSIIEAVEEEELAKEIEGVVGSTVASTFNSTVGSTVGSAIGSTSTKKLLVREKIGLECVWNMDEVGVTTVSTPEKIVGRKGQKQIESIVSGERGVLVTVCCVVSSYAILFHPSLSFLE